MPESDERIVGQQEKRTTKVLAGPRRKLMTGRRRDSRLPNDSVVTVSKILPKEVQDRVPKEMQGRVLLQAAGQWKIRTSGTEGRFRVQVSKRDTKEPEARSSEKVSKKTQGKGEEHPHFR
jgi:hypothetical protein